MEFALASLLNLKMADWGSDDPNEIFSNRAALAIFCTLWLIIAILAYFLVLNFDQFRFEGFVGSYGALVDGTRYNTRKRRAIAITYPATFLLQRAVFVYSVLYVSDFLWGQVAIQLLTSILMIAYLLTFKPLETPFSTNLEVMN